MRDELRARRGSTGELIRFLFDSGWECLGSRRGGAARSWWSRQGSGWSVGEVLLTRSRCFRFAVSPLLPHVRRSKLKTLEETPSSHSSSIRIDVLAQTSCHSSVHPFRRRLVRFKLDRRPELSASSRLPFPFGHPAALSRRCFVVVGEHVFYG